MLRFYGNAFSPCIVDGIRRSSAVQREIVIVVFIWQKGLRGSVTLIYNDSLVNEQDRQYTIFAVEKHKYYIFRVCVCL